MNNYRSRKKYFIFFVLSAILIVLGACTPIDIISPTFTPLASSAISQYSYKIINTYPHDPAAFTQGLIYDNGFLYESTGIYGKSSLRCIELETGNILQNYMLPDKYFGEGITLCKDLILQLTWQSCTGFIYEKSTFDLLKEFSYPTEGWGITCDGKRLIISDGTANLYFWDMETLQPIGQVEVHDNDTPVTKINELEYVDGKIYANIWQTDNIAIIEPQDGQVTGWIDLSGILGSQHYTGTVDVLNGIAYDTQTKRLFVTGKYWPFLFEIELVLKS